MFSTKLKTHVSLKCPTQIFGNIKSSARYASNTETLEPVKLSYASYESTVSNGHDQASPLIIMHGLFGSKSNWNSLCKAYNQKSNPPRKIIAVDARNHGDSPHNDNHSYAYLAADIKALFEQLAIPRATLMGHSMGGRAVMLFALKYPELVDRLVVADISPITTSPNINTMPDLFRTLDTVRLPSEISMSQARASVDSQLEKTIPSKDLRSFLLTNLIQRDDGSYNWRLNISALTKNFNNIAKFPLIDELQYDGPTLFLAGSNSDYIQGYKEPEINKILHLNYLPDEVEQPKNCIYCITLLNEPHYHLSYCYENSKNSNHIAVKTRLIPNVLLFSFVEYSVALLASAGVSRAIFEKQHRVEFLLAEISYGKNVAVATIVMPELVEKLIVAEISPITTSRDFKQIPKILYFMKKIEIPHSASLAEARKLMGQQLFAVYPNKQLVQFMLSNLVQKSEGSYSWRFNAKSLIQNFEYITAFPDIHNLSYDGPVLFVGGSKSDHIQKSDYPKIRKLFPNAELKYIEGAGHWLHSEKPAEFLKITLDFLNQTVPKSN